MALGEEKDCSLVFQVCLIPLSSVSNMWLTTKHFCDFCMKTQAQVQSWKVKYIVGQTSKCRIPGPYVQFSASGKCTCWQVMQ